MQNYQLKSHLPSREQKLLNSHSHPEGSMSKLLFQDIGVSLKETTEWDQEKNNRNVGIAPRSE